MLYLAIPAQNEVATIGVLLWRLRTVLAEFPREYEVVVYDDASSDETATVAEQYVHAMPVTVLRGTKAVGYAGAVDALARYIAGQTRYPRRDAMLLLQGDFTDPPGIVPEFARRFEGGADLVVGERNAVADAPQSVRRLFTAAGWALRPFVRVNGIRDLTGSMRLVRISALRDLLRTVGDAPVCEGDSWTANADLLLRLVPHARRVESVPVEPTYGVRTRESRRITVRDGLAALRWAWRARGRKATPTTAPESGAAEAPQRAARPANTPRRRDDGEVTADALRERSRERDRLRGESDAAPSRRDGRPERGRRDGARDATRDSARESAREATRDASPDATREAPRESTRESAPANKRERDPARDAARDARKQEQRDARRTAAKDGNAAAKPPREKRARDRAVRADDADVILDDPFAARTPRTAPAETIATREETLPAPESTDASEQAMSLRDRRVEAPRVDADNDQIDPDDEGADDDASEAAEPDDASDTSPGSEARERKRRRNRRSRRRKNRQKGEANLENAAEGDEPATESRERPERTAGNVARTVARRSPESAASDDIDRDDDSDDLGANDAEDDAPSAEGAVGDAQDGSDGQPARSRRRGRRGRRGGSRRGRGRNREGASSGDGAGDAGAADGGSSPSEPATE